ncbi:MAG TPA: hypothetical protein EYO74_02115 [Piscirickettsiaceae bacterium]|nr:hypothetical protein [Piscirickettsiaceae bacterium]
MIKYALIAVSFSFVSITGCSYLEDATFSEPSSEGIIQVNHDLYYVAIERDKDGCMMYHARSEKQATLSVILYQNKTGVFATVKNPDDCY